MEKDSNEKLDSVEQLLKDFMQKLMGKSLDFARISGVSDRSFDQFKRSLKDEGYLLLDKYLVLFNNLQKNV